MNKKQSSRLVNALDNLRGCEDKVRSLIKEVFPIGCPVYYQHGNQYRHARVSNYAAMGFDLLVETGSSSVARIDVRRILKAMTDKE
jgi:hypothetical protein